MFTVELLAEMQDRGDLIKDSAGRLIAPDPLEWNKLPSRVEAVVEERIERLTEDLRETLTVASVEGQDFTAQIVARVRNLRERDLFKQLFTELSKQHQLIHESGEQKVGKQTYLQRYSFTHAYFYQYLYRSLARGEKRSFHAEIAEILEELYAGHTEQVALQLAQHHAEAGDFEAAVTYFLQAGEASFRLEEFDTARDIFEQAIALIENDGETYPQLYTDLLWWIGETLYQNGKHQAAQEYARHATKCARSIPDNDRVTRSLLSEAAALWQQRINYEKALTLLDEALRLARKSDNRLHEASALRHKGVVFGRLERPFDEIVSLYGESLDICVEHDHLKGQRACLNNLGDVHEKAGKFVEAHEYFQGALHIALQVPSRAGEGISCHNLSNVFLSLGHYAKAIEFAERHIEVRTALENFYAVSAGHRALGNAFFCTDKLNEAIDSWSKSIELAVRHDNAVSQIRSGGRLALCHLHTGRIAQALQVVRDIRPLFTKKRMVETTFTSQLLEAILLLRL